MSVKSAVLWWEESQMRVLVLGSLGVQFLLLILTFWRRRAIPGWIRFVTWLAYLGSDAIAIYALAMLFNRHKHQDYGSKSTVEVVWAPILLIHLGGQDGITAYNIEDNELWGRHFLTAVSQVTVAIYVFWKSWPPGGYNKRLLQASIVLFALGVVKCFTKAWALKRASITSLVSAPHAKRTAKQDKAGEMDPHSLEKYVKRAKAFVQEQKDEGERACVENDDHHPSHQAQVNKDGMEDPFEEDTKPTGSRPTRKERRERILRGEACKLFIDLSYPDGGRRLGIFKYFWVLINQEKKETTTTRESEEEEFEAHTAYRYVRGGLASAFLLLYTKLKTAPGIPTDIDFEVDGGGPFFCRHWILISVISRLVLPWAAIVLFNPKSTHSHTHGEAYIDTDVKITNALLLCTAVLEICSCFPIDFTEHKAKIPWWLPVDKDYMASLRRREVIVRREQWPERVAQYSLVGYFARNKNHGKLMWIASNFGCKDMVDRRWCMEPCFSSRGITELVLQYLKNGWEKKIQDVATYRSFNDNRGHWALEGNENLSWSIKEPFDESVLLWHIATDFCFFSSQEFSEHTRVCDFAKQQPTWQSLLEYLEVLIPSKTNGSTKCGQRLAGCKAVQCRQISNYMVYLLFVNPEMLLPGTRRNLFTTAYHELKDILGDKAQSFCCCCHQVVEKGLMETLINTMWDRSNKQDAEIPAEEKSKQGHPKGGCKGNFIDDAWDLAQGLLKLKHDFGKEKMWEVIQGVWVEMLCFSANRCRGYLHAKALGSGGEFLSYIWLLLFYMGMETFTERLQREKEEPPSREANNNAAPSVSDADNGSGSASSSGSGIRNRAAQSPSHLHTGMLSTSSSDEIKMFNLV